MDNLQYEYCEQAEQYRCFTHKMNLITFSGFGKTKEAAKASFVLKQPKLSTGEVKNTDATTKYDEVVMTESTNKQINVIEGAVKAMFFLSKVVPVYIESNAGAGREALIKALKASNQDIEIVGDNQPLTSSKKTYLIDDVGTNGAKIAKAAQEHAKKGGLVIFVTECVKSLGLPPESIIKHFALANGSLVCIKDND